jgi:hypothetical protein
MQVAGHHTVRHTSNSWPTKLHFVVFFPSISLSCTISCHFISFRFIFFSADDHFVKHEISQNEFFIREIRKFVSLPFHENFFAKRNFAGNPTHNQLINFNYFTGKYAIIKFMYLLTM